MFFNLSCAFCRTTLFFFNDTATTEIYTLSPHDALPISGDQRGVMRRAVPGVDSRQPGREQPVPRHGIEHPDLPQQHHDQRSEEHTSELQSLAYLVCRLLLEKKKKIYN